MCGFVSRGKSRCHQEGYSLREPGQRELLSAKKVPPCTWRRRWFRNRQAAGRRKALPAGPGRLLSLIFSSWNSPFVKIDSYILWKNYSIKYFLIEKIFSRVENILTKTNICSYNRIYLLEDYGDYYNYHPIRSQKETVCNQIYSNED